MYDKYINDKNYLKSVFAKNLCKYVDKSGKTQKELAKIIGVSESTFSSWCLGEKTPRMDKIQKLANYFKIKNSALLEEENFDEKILYNMFDNISPIKTQRIPLLGEIACGQPIYAVEDRESYVEVGTDIRADFCLRAKGDSMTGARIQDGDIVFIRRQQMVDNGEIAAVIIEDEATLKRVFYFRDENKLVLNPENPKFAPLVYVGEELNHIHILGKAIAFQSDL